MTGNPKAKPWDPSEPNAIECLQIVYKVAERCNINCTYCYYFNMGDNTALGRPARASAESTADLARWIAEGCAQLAIPAVNISFHGGEPMLVGPRRFAAMCAAFRTHVAPVAALRFSMQTNGTMFSDAWLDVLRRFEVSVGVSIDGARPDHDRYRLDRRGRSTFAATEATIRALVKASGTHPFLRPSTISVLDRDVDYAATYRYLRDLGVEAMHFLLPDRNAGDRSRDVEAEAAAIGAGMLDLFTEWMTEDDPRIEVRFIAQTLGYFRRGASFRPVPRRRKTNQILVARTDGTVAVDDSYIPALDWYAAVPDFAIADHDLKSVLAHEIFRSIEAETNRVPDGCSDCRWRGICRGGDLENRFAPGHGFNNRSIYCEAYKVLYPGVCDTLVRNGYPVAEIERRFGTMQHV